MSKIITFGHMFSNNSISEWTISCRVIESAFVTYREQLASFMKELVSVYDSMSTISFTSRTKSNEISGIHSHFGGMIGEIPRLWELNENVLRKIVNPLRSLKFVYGLLDPLNYNSNDQVDSSQNMFITPKSTNQPSSLASYNSLDQILIHLSRDWSEAGASVREKLYYQGVLSVISRVFPPNPLNYGATAMPLVLVPGAGLGRLGVEIASMGFRVEMNELSSSMVCAFQSIMDILRHRTNQSEPKSEKNNLEFYPHLNFYLIDDWDFSSRLKPQSFPFTSDSFALNKILYGECDSSDQRRGAPSSLFDRLTVQFGGFDAVYSAANSNDHGSRFDLVVTCFFIDTAENVLDYIDIIYHVLRPGGLWINVGPLHYHHYGRQRQQQARQEVLGKPSTGRSRPDEGPRTVPFSYAQLLQVIAVLGFDELDLTSNEASPQRAGGIGLGRVVEVTYCGEDANSMKPEVYRVPLAAFRSRKQ